MKKLTGIAAFAAVALLPMGLATTSAATSTGVGLTALVAAQADEKDRYTEKAADVKEKQEKKIDQADRDAAAARALPGRRTQPADGWLRQPRPLHRRVPPATSATRTTRTARCRSWESPRALSPSWVTR